MSDHLPRRLGLWQATALNVAMIVGAGVFVTIPLMLRELRGPYALLGWTLAGLLIVLDALVWGELGAALPGSGGSFRYLLESYGRDGWGRLMAFLFIWQFMLSGPLELASGLIAMDAFSQALSPEWAAFNKAHTLAVPIWQSGELGLTFSPARFAAAGLALVIVATLYRNVTTLGRLTVLFCAVVVAILAWVLVEGAIRFDPGRAFPLPDAVTPPDRSVVSAVGAAMTLALYSYFGYYNVCYLGDEVRDPGRTLPRAVVLSAVAVAVLFTLTHLAFTGVVGWREIPTEKPAIDEFSLPAAFMGAIHGRWAVQLVTACLLASCFISAFAGMLGYSRIPFSAAREGHFFAAVGAVHPTRQIPHVSLLTVGGLTAFWTFFDLENVIKVLVTTRVLEQFVAQAVGLMILRRARPDLARPFRVPGYPWACVAVIGGWLFVYLTSPWVYAALGLATMGVGALVYAVWVKRRGVESVP